MSINIKKNWLALFFYFVVALVFLRGIVFSSGLIIQEDMAPPLTSLQIQNLYDAGRYSWDFNHLVSYRNYSVGAATPIQFFQYALSLVGVGGELYIKLFLLFLFSFVGFSMFLLLRYLKVDFFVSIFGGFFYISTPLFFDYTIMGWHFVLLVLGLLPLSVKYFIRSVEEKNFRCAVISGLLYAFSFVQSQAVCWFFIVFVFLGVYLIKNKETLISYLKTIFINLFLFFFVNLYAILSLLIYPDRAVSGSDYLYANASLGMMYNFYPSNIIRLWGAIYNYQYETVIFNYDLIFLSFIPPLMAGACLLIKKYRKLAISFWLISLVPLVVYYLKPYRILLLHIPFSNIIRDFARFSVLSVFGYAILVSLTINYFFYKYKNTGDKRLKFSFFALSLAWLIYLFPWWNGEISSWKNQTGVDSRMVTKVFPNEYFEMEQLLSKKKNDFKVMYLPLAYNGVTQITDDPKYKGLRDLFAIYSPKPGLFSLSDRNLGPSEFINLIKNNKFKLAELLNVDLIIIRKNMQPEGLDEMENEKTEDVINELNQENNLYENKKFSKLLENEKLLVYSVNNFSPHFWVSEKNIVSERKVEDISRMISYESFNNRTAIFFESQNNGKKAGLEKASENNCNSETTDNSNCASNPILEFKKINPIKYRVRIHGASGNFPLVFSETFHEGWKIYLSENSGFFSKVGQEKLKNYKIIDGNEREQAAREEVSDYIEKGWISTVGDGKTKEINHKKWENSWEKLVYVEKYSIDFISKNFQNSIQNDNLPNGSIFETWFRDSIDEKNHLVANGYANSWVVDPEEICPSSSSKKEMAGCIKNADGTYDFEIIVEFWPQRLFVIGAGMSAIILMISFGYLAYKQKKKKISKENGNIK